MSRVTDFDFEKVVLKNNYEDWLLTVKGTGEVFHVTFDDLKEDCDFLEAREFCDSYLKKLYP